MDDIETNPSEVPPSNGSTDWPGPRETWADNATPGIRNKLTHEQRERAADNLGPNWASILSGCGDQ